MAKLDKAIKILVVEDDPRVVRLLRANLEAVGYEVFVALNGEDAINLYDLKMPDLVILDIMLPTMDGFEVCKRIREFSSAPIIMLTAKADEAEKVRGLQLGADDYMTKPFGVPELLARVEAVLRRSKSDAETDSPSEFKADNLCVDFVRHRVSLAGEEVLLTPTEYKLLYHLVRNAGRVMLHHELLTKVWGAEYHDEVEYLRAYIRHLRKKIEEDPQNPKFIQSRPGIGYIFVQPR